MTGRAAHTAPVRATVALAFGSFVLIGASDGATGVLLPSMQAHYGIGAGVVGLLFLFSTAGYIAAALTSGLLLERLGRRWFLALGAVIFTGSALAIGSVLPFPAMLGALVTYGFAFGILDAGMNAYITAMPGSTGRLNLLHACYGGGAFLGPLIASAVLARGGPWNLAYLLWSAIGALLLVGCIAAFPPGRPAMHAPDAAGRNVLTGTLRLRAVWIAALFMLAYVGVEVSVGNWAYSVLTEARREIPLLSGWAVSGYWFGLTGGRLALAYLAPRLRVGNRALMQACLVAVVTGLLIAWFVPLLPVTAAGLFLTGLGAGPIYPIVMALVPGLVAGRLVPSAVGLLAGSGGVGGAFFPWLAGNVAQIAGIAALMPYFVAVALLMCLWWLALRARAHAPGRVGL